MLCSYILVLHSSLNRTNTSPGTVGAQYSYQSTRVKPSIPYWNRVPNRVLCETGLSDVIVTNRISGYQEFLLAFESIFAVFQNGEQEKEFIIHVRVV